MSVIVPVYNVEKYLPQCVDSILKQTFPNIELILVDDGSTDRSGQICNAYAEEDRRVRVIHKENGGLSSARNAGINAAEGQYILLVDSDDYWSNLHMLEIVERHLDDNKRRLVVWRYQKCREQETITYEQEEYAAADLDIGSDCTYLFQSGILFASACYMAIPRALFDGGALRFEIGVTAEDIEWFGRLLAKIESVTYIDAPFLIYRKREGSISSTVTPETVRYIQSHLCRLIDLEESNRSEVLSVYLGEQAANYVIVLSRCKGKVKAMRRDIPIKGYLKRSVRRRSRLISKAVNTLGLNRTIAAIRLIDRIRGR